MGFNNIKRIMAWSNVHITNINRSLKGIKSEVVINFIRSDNKDIVVTTNKVVATSDLNVVEKYMKNLNNVNSSNIMSPRLPQLKSYLKTLGISYLVEDSNFLVIHEIIKKVLETTHIFNNVVLSFWPHIVKASPKLNMAVI